MELKALRVWKWEEKKSPGESAGGKESASHVFSYRDHGGGIQGAIVRESEKAWVLRAGGNVRGFVPFERRGRLARKVKNLL